MRGEGLREEKRGNKGRRREEIKGEEERVWGEERGMRGGERG